MPNHTYISPKKHEKGNEDHLIKEMGTLQTQIHEPSSSDDQVDYDINPTHDERFLKMN